MDLIAASQNLKILSLARGEELFGTLLNWCATDELQGATFTGLGAADSLTLGYYNLQTQAYEKHEIVEEVEILSLMGNLGTLKGEKMLHIHGTFGRRDLSAFGGHLFRLRVSGACELHLKTLPHPVLRAFDPETGLNLLCSPSKASTL